MVLRAAIRDALEGVRAAITLEQPGERAEARAEVETFCGCLIRAPGIKVTIEQVRALYRSAVVSTQI